MNRRLGHSTRIVVEAPRRNNENYFVLEYRQFTYDDIFITQTPEGLPRLYVACQYGGVQTTRCLWAKFEEGKWVKEFESAHELCEMSLRDWARSFTQAIKLWDEIGGLDFFLPFPLKNTILIRNILRWKSSPVYCETGLMAVRVILHGLSFTFECGGVECLHCG